MIYLLQGLDTIKARRKFESLIASLLARKKDSSQFRMEAENFDPNRLTELIVSQDLFVNKYIVGCAGLLSDKKSQEFMLANLVDMKDSPNIFILLEENLDEKILPQIKKFAEKELSFEKIARREERFNIFSLTDALGEKNRRQLWVLYQKALRLGIEDEEIFWKFAWMIKNMLLVKKAKDVSKTELKGFVLKKTQGYAKNYSAGELETLSSDLVNLFHNIRKGEGEMNIGLEKIIFGI